MDLLDLGVRRALVVTDPNLAGFAPVRTVSRRSTTRVCGGPVIGSVSNPPTNRSATRLSSPTRRNVERDRGGRRRVRDRLGQSGEPLHNLSSSGLPRLRQCAHRESDACSGSAQAGVSVTRTCAGARGDRCFAVGAHCTHYRGPLADGLVIGDTVRCPLHHACFSLDTRRSGSRPALDPIACWRSNSGTARCSCARSCRRPTPAPQRP